MEIGNERNSAPEKAAQAKIKLLVLILLQRDWFFLELIIKTFGSFPGASFLT